MEAYLLVTRNLAITKITKIEQIHNDIITFLRGQDARHGSSDYPATINQIAPLKIAASIVKKNNLNKKVKFLHCSRATFTQEDVL